MIKKMKLPEHGDLVAKNKLAKENAIRILEL
jgi:hypothetical protein